MDYASLVEEARELNEQCKEAFRAEEFEQGNALLKARQSKLEDIVEAMNSLPASEDSAIQLRSFLAEVLEDDKRQANYFNGLKDQALQDNIRQKKTSKALNSYAKVNRFS
ncbi:hypothetical protein ACFSJY_17890 [Thalassotalea euphylliae]|uniref:hypothetical protein n=1 Tax=Thalassotalea euphylliae TaxID=1655234 RepID=UPI0036432721